jgi:type II secretory pathway pseudopilin PulG
MDRRGFTLPELLIFMAILSASVAGLITILVAVTRVQGRQSSANEVQTQGQFLLQQIQYYVQAARLLDMTQDVATGTLKMRTFDLTVDPSFVNVSTGTAYLQQGANGTPQALTSNRVTVSNLLFTRHYGLNGSSSAYGNDSVSFSFTIAANTSNTKLQYSQAFQSAASIFAPVGKIALLQQAQKVIGSPAVTIVTSTYPTSNATGSLLIAVVSNAASSAVVSISDTAGNTWTNIANPKYGAYNQEITIFDALNSKNSSNTVTVSSSIGLISTSLFIYEYRGASTSSSFDASSTLIQSNTGSPTSSSTNPSPGPELIFGVLYSSNSFGAESPNPGNGFTTEATSSMSGTFTEDQNLFVTSPVAATWQYPTRTPSSSATVITFK